MPREKPAKKREAPKGSGMKHEEMPPKGAKHMMPKMPMKKH